MAPQHDVTELQEGSGAAVQFMVRDTQATRIGLVLTKDCQFLQLSWTNTGRLCH